MGAMLKSTNTSIQDHLKTMVMARGVSVSNAYPRAEHAESMNTSIQSHLKNMIIATTCFNFKCLSYGGVS